MKKPFEKGQPANSLLRKWWESLEDNKGERAELSRCATPTEVLLCPAFYNIAEPLEKAGIGPEKRESLAAVVGLLANIRQDAPQMSTPEAMARGDGKPKVSPARFRRLLEAQSVDELYPILRRVLGLLDKTANVSDLAASVYDWDNETRKRWASKYFINAPKKVAILKPHQTRSYGNVPFSAIAPLDLLPAFQPESRRSEPAEIRHCGWREATAGLLAKSQACLAQFGVVPDCSGRPRRHSYQGNGAEDV